jgi:hypothetical protein
MVVDSQGMPWHPSEIVHTLPMNAGQHVALTKAGYRTLTPLTVAFGVMPTQAERDALAKAVASQTGALVRR